MPRDTTAKLTVTFAKSLPMGTRATFTHDGELWIAYPASKNTEIIAVLDRLIGLHNGIGNEMVRWINARPQDAELIARVLPWVARARELHGELTIEKAKAVTS